MHCCINLGHERLARFATELIGVQGIGKVIVNVRGVERRYEVCEGVAVRGLVEAAEDCVSIDVQLDGELSGGLFG